MLTNRINRIIDSNLYLMLFLSGRSENFLLFFRKKTYFFVRQVDLAFFDEKTDSLYHLSVRHLQFTAKAISVKGKNEFNALFYLQLQV